jgi:predicted HicB family RNase H-like nuclease
MAIAKKPNSKTTETADEERAKAFITKSGALQTEPEQEPTEGNRKPTMIRIPPALLKRIDEGAKRLGISRSAFIVQSAAEKLEAMNN